MPGNETWSGTVTLTGDVTVPNNVTLTILPGTLVACWDKYDDQAGGLNTSRIELIIDRGIMNAAGTSNNPIVFTSSPLHPPTLPGDWFGVRINSGTNGLSTIQHCRFEYATKGLSIESGGSLSIGYCVFANELRLRCRHFRARFAAFMCRVWPGGGGNPLNSQQPLFAKIAKAIPTKCTDSSYQGLSQ